MTKEDYEIMKDLSFDKKDVKLAEVRYYYMEGLPVGRTIIRPEKDRVYVFLLKNGDHYFNIINCEELPVYERYTQDVLELAYGEEQEGLCYVVDPMTNNIFHSKTVTLRDIVDYMINNSRFFVDRSELIKKRIVPMYQKDRIRIMCEDSSKLENFNQYLDEIGTGYQYRKK